MKNIITFLLLLSCYITQGQVRKLTLSDIDPENASGFQGTKQCCSYSFENATDTVRFGLRSLRVELNKTDPPPTDGSGSLRSEKYKNYSSTIAGQDTTYQWYAFSMLSQRSSNAVDPAEELRFQLHSNVGSPVCALEVKNGIWRAVRRNSLQPTPTYANGGYTDLDSINFDAWEDWIIQFIPKTNSSGRIRIWRNDVLMYSYDGVTNYSNSNAIYPYPNIGVYKWPWASTWVPASTSTKRVFFLDSVFYSSSSATYADMDVTAPTTNIPPVISTGGNQFLTNGTTSTNITATATDADGIIIIESLTQVSGPNSSSIGSKLVSEYPVSGLIAGTYEFMYQVADDDGAFSSANVQVTVSNPFIPPTVTIVWDSIVRGTSTTKLVLNASGNGGATITDYQWDRIDGVASYGVIVSSSNDTTLITGLIPGMYIIRGTATDSNGEQTSVEVPFIVMWNQVRKFIIRKPVKVIIK